MSGILDNKSRIIDAIITTEGRRQMAEGTFEVSYVTFSDADVVYLPDSSAGHVDPTNRIYFEACNLPQDQITFEANDEGNLVPFRAQNITLKTPGGNVSSSYAEGSLVNGKLTVRQYHQGRRIKTSGITENKNDANKGFVYTDTSGVEAKILINPTGSAGIIVTSSVPSYVAFVGTQGGLAPQQFADALSKAIAALSSSGGPDVSATASDGSVYLDGGYSFIGTKIYSTGTLSSPLLIEGPAIGGRLLTDEVENASFASQIQGILTSSFDNFLELQTLSTVNRLFEDDKFELSTNELTFDLDVASSLTLRALTASPPSLNSIDSLFSDDKLSHLENFMYLPPIVKTSDTLLPDKSKVESLGPYLLGNYPSWGDNEKKLSYRDIMYQVKQYSDIKPSVRFTKTSINNMVVGQFFEVTSNTVNKLDVVDYGSVLDDSDPENVTFHRVFFVGKVFLDNRGTTCFVNMFTLIFSKDPDNSNEGLMK